MTKDSAVERFARSLMWGAMICARTAASVFHIQRHTDDVFWSIALAVYATVEMAPEPFLAVIPR